MPSTIANLCEVVKGTFDDYKILKEYHYIISDPCCCRGIYKIRAKYPYTKQFPDPIGIIVYVAPIADLEARHKATNNFFTGFQTDSERIRQTNRFVTYIARIIIDPRFHKQGLATMLLKESIPLQPQPIIETLTPLDFTTKMFSKFGFKEIHNPTPQSYSRIQDALKKVGIPPELWSKPDVCQYRIDHLSRHYHALIHREIKIFLKKFKAFRTSRPGLTRTKYLMSKVVYPNSYQIRISPDFDINFDVNNPTITRKQETIKNELPDEKTRKNIIFRVGEPNSTKTVSRNHYKDLPPSTDYMPECKPSLSRQNLKFPTNHIF